MPFGGKRAYSYLIKNVNNHRCQRVNLSYVALRRANARSACKRTQVSNTPLLSLDSSLPKRRPTHTTHVSLIDDDDDESRRSQRASDRVFAQIPYECQCTSLQASALPTALRIALLRCRSIGGASSSSSEFACVLFVCV